MSSVLAMVLAGGRVDELLCLTEQRPKSALPVFATYRIIDFVLSNLMHSGISNVGVLSQYRPYALVRHIGTGEHWDFVGRSRSIRILPPYRGFKASDWYQGTADAVYQNISYIESFDPQHVLIASADHIYRMDYRPFIEFHIEKGADATISFTRKKSRSSRFGYGVISRNGILRDYQEKPNEPPSDWVSMTLYLFNRDFLIDVLKKNAKERSHEFGSDIIPKIVSSARVFGYKHDGYWAYARTVDSYYKTNMNIINGKVALKDWQVRTNLLERCARADRLPAYINGDVINSVVSEGCIIEGKVRNSILSPGVAVANDSEVVDSIVFHDTIIGRNTKLNKVICDKDSRIGEGCMVGGFGRETKSGEFGDLLHSGITVLGRNTVVPNKTTIGANTAIYSSGRITVECVQPGSTLR
ncbi:MAG: glucose-1-phosphate adenylyltransferase [candidate division WOR-3 bacterium]|nr:MAG: glucose-1-phosphate adenylyltransferase [candidate division WOR-3 bacterium]